jgi:MFS family permease
VHPHAPTAGFTLVLIVMALGSVAGPLVLGPLADAIGLRPVFVVLAALPLAGMLLRPGAPRRQSLVRTTRNLASPDIIRS